MPSSGQTPVEFRVEIAADALTGMVEITNIPLDDRLAGLVAIEKHIASLKGKLQQEKETKKNEPSKPSAPAYEPSA